MIHSVNRLSSIRRALQGARRWRVHGLMAVALVAFVTMASGTYLTAQAPDVDLRLWEGVFLQEQADRGSVAYAANCARCHGDNLQGDQRFAALQGDRWWGNFQGRTVEDLFQFISNNMPNGAGGSLGQSMYQDLTAFILSRNGVPAGATELTADSGSGIPIIPESGEALAIPSGTLAKVVGCLAQGGDSGWMIQSGTAPIRDGVVSDADATMALGNRTVPLLFVMQSLGDMVGHRVAATGLLVGDDGVDGVNVTIVTSVADTCP